MKAITLDNVEIPFDPSWTKISVSVSGGADSALLAYILCNYIQQNDLNISVHFINHIRNWKTKPWQSDDLNRVWDAIREYFPQINFQRHINFIAPDLEWSDKGPTLVDEYGKTVSGDIIQLRSYAEYICHQHNIDAYYNAVTRNPRGVEFTGMYTRDIEPTENNTHLVIMQHLGKWAIHPFRFVEKNWIYKQYKNLGILKLWELTRSCEGTVSGVDYTNYVGQVIPTCGDCFWCKEREWAIAQSK